MNPKDLQVVFFGTPVLASYCLSTLVDNGYNIVGVVTAPDKPAGRGQLLKESEVKKFASSKNLPVFQPTNLKDQEFNQTLEYLKPDVQVVVAFRMLPEVVWRIPNHGTFNMHASLLPNYRGAAPINWAIINQEKKTGVSTFFIDNNIDSGEVIMQKEIIIDEKETAGTLHDKVMIEGALLILKTLNAIAQGDARITKQAEIDSGCLELKKAPKIFKETCKIDWNQSCFQAEALVRGLSPAPGAFTLVNSRGLQKVMKIFEAEARQESHTHQIGSFVSVDRSDFGFAAADGFLIPKVVQLEGKKVMTLRELLRGSQLV